jgi:hypothetical protein
MKYLSVAILVLSIFLFSCKKINNNCSSKINSAIISVNSPTLAGSVNQELNFELVYGIANGCGISSEIESIKEGNVIAINIKTQFEGCVCTEIFFEEKKTYTFKSSTVGNFKLKFSKGNNTFIEKDVVIQ